MGLRLAASLINAWALVHPITVVDERGEPLKLPVIPRYGGRLKVTKRQKVYKSKSQKR